MTTTLVEFLLARIAEDEALALEVQEKVKPDGDFGPHYYEHAGGSYAAIIWDVDYKQGGYTITAARVLAECQAKRRIVEAYERAAMAFPDPEEEYSVGSTEGAEDALDGVMRLLALPFASHPDYEESWRV